MGTGVATAAVGCVVVRVHANAGATTEASMSVKTTVTVVSAAFMCAQKATGAVWVFNQAAITYVSMLLCLSLEYH